MNGEQSQLALAAPYCVWPSEDSLSWSSPDHGPSVLPALLPKEELFLLEFWMTAQISKAEVSGPTWEHSVSRNQNLGCPALHPKCLIFDHRTSSGSKVNGGMFNRASLPTWGFASPPSEPPARGKGQQCP